MNKINIFRNTSILLYAQVITVVTSLIYFSALARVFTKEEYGAFSQIFILITISVVIFSFSIPLSIQYFIAQANNRAEQERVLNQIINVCMVLCFIAFIAIYFTFPFLSSNLFDNNDIYSLKFYAIFLVISQIISSTFDYTFVTLNKLKVVFLRKTYFSVLKLIITFITYFNELSLHQFLLLLTILEFCFAAYTFLLIKKEIKNFTFLLDMQIVKKIVLYSYPLAIAAIIAILNVEFSKIFVSINYKIDVFAEYSILSRELPLYIVGTSLTAVLIPVISKKISENKIEQAVKVWHSSIELSLIATVWLVGLLIVMSKEIITILYSSKYLDGNIIFVIFSVILLTKVIYFGLFLRSTGRTNLLLLSSLFSLVTTVLLTFFLSFWFGVVGVALAVLISTFLTGLLQLSLSARVIKIKLKRLFPWKSTVSILLFNLAIGVTMQLVKTFINGYIFNDFVSLVIISLIWFSLLVTVYFKRIRYLRFELSK